MSDEWVGLVLIAAILLFVGVVLGLATGWHPIRWRVHRRQRALLESSWQPPEHSRFWEVFYPAIASWNVATGVWVIADPFNGWALLSLIVTPIIFASTALTHFAYKRWYDGTGKWKVGTWRALPVKELDKSRVIDTMKVKRRVRKPSGGWTIEERDVLLEGCQTGGISPEGPGLTTRNKGTIVLAKARHLAESHLKRIREMQQAGFTGQVPFVSGIPQGDTYWTPGDPLAFLYGYDRDKENPTPDVIREFIQAHPQNFRPRPSTLILFVPDLYPAYEALDTTPAPKPTNFAFLIEDLQFRVGGLVEKLRERGVEDQAIASSRRPQREFEVDGGQFG